MPDNKKKGQTLKEYLDYTAKRKEAFDQKIKRSHKKKEGSNEGNQKPEVK